MGRFPYAKFVKFLPNCTEEGICEYFSHLASCLSHSEPPLGRVEFWMNTKITEESFIKKVEAAEIASICGELIRKPRSRFLFASYTPTLTLTCAVEGSGFEDVIWLVVWLSKMPHIDGSIFKLQEVLTGELALSSKVADVVLFSTDKHLQGACSAVYLLRKLELIKPFNRSYSRGKWMGGSNPLFTLFTEIGVDLKLKNCEASRPDGSLFRLVQECDQRLLALWGRDEFAKRIKGVGVELDIWLAAIR